MRGSRRSDGWLIAAIAVAAGAAIAVGGERPAHAIERTLAGSAQLDYHLVTSFRGDTTGAGVPGTFGGFTVESGLKLAADVSDHVSANVKVCYGCHGFEADMAYFDLRAADELNLRFGRFSPSFGAFNLRHDPANHKLSDKPLPYDMGRMLRRSVWGNGVLPSPFPDNGAELNGLHWFGESISIDYALYAVMGFRQNGPNPTELNFQASHQQYYVDNNSRPTVGGRLGFTVKLGGTSDLTLGASGLGGTYDPRNRYTYVIAGSDVTLRIERTTLRAEYLVRAQGMDTTNPGIFKYELAAGRGDFFTKQGGYVELEQPLRRDLDVILRTDGMLRNGNVVQTSALDDGSTVMRGTLGLAFAVERNLRLKESTEIWQFSEKDAEGRSRDVSIHLGAVGSF